MTTIRRLAVLDRGEIAAQVLAALADHNRDTEADPVRTLAVLTEPEAAAWYSQEADETLDLTGLAGRDGRLGADAFVAELATADADAVWIGRAGVVDAAEQVALLAACESAGLAVVGPSSEVLRLLADPDGLRAAADSADVHLEWAAKAPTRVRSVDVDVVADASGGVWVFAPREASVRQDGRTVLVESPTADLGAAGVAALTGAARRLVEAIGYVGVVTVGFELGVRKAAAKADAAPAWRLTGLRPQELGEQATTEETHDVDLTRLALGVARGEALPAETPEARGHAVGVRLQARDASGQAGLRAPGTVLLLDVPPTSGVRVDARLRPGDEVSDAAPTLARLTAWGHTREQALSRLRRTLDLTSAVVGGGTSDRAFLLSILAMPELSAGAVDAGWLGRLVAEGKLAAAPSAVALLVAAAEAYAADLAAAESAFLAKAARGRPERPEDVGGRVLLGYRGAVYSVRVDLNAPGEYRVSVPEAEAHLSLERVGEYERRVTCGGRRHRVVLSTDGTVMHVEVDGALHVVTREDGVVVRTAFPAFVVALLVEPGDTVQAGEPVAVLESMKMESTVPAPFGGEVIRLEVASNVQVEAGAPLLRLRADDAADEVQPGPDGQRVDLSGFGRGHDPRQKPCDRVYGPLRDYLLGYDLDPTTLTRLLAAQRRLAELSPADDASLLSCEDSLLDLYADLGALSRPRTEADAFDEVAGVGDGVGDGGVGEDDSAQDVRTGSAQEYLIAFLRWLDADQAMLPPAYRARLLAALGRYGVRSLERTPELESAVVRLYSSTWRVRELTGVISQILTRRLDETDALLGLVGSKERALLDRLAAATQGRQQEVADLARDVRFHFLDEPVLESVVSDVYAEMEGHFLALAANPSRPDRAHRIERLVWCPNPMRAMLLRQWLTAGDGPNGIGLRKCVLEVYARRFYRSHTVHDLHVDEVAGRVLAVADYAEDGTEIHVVVGHVPLDELPDFSLAVAEHVAAADLPEGTEVVVDLATWHSRPRASIDEMAVEAGNLLGQCQFGRHLRRVELTVTSTAGVGKDHMRTQHVSFGQNEDGTFVEEKFFRNLHSRLTRRLELWRLSNFELERLPSAEDVYLFNGVARTNPKDRRLFALAEVRDLVPVRSPDGTVSYPRLERMGLQALAALRAALAGFPARQRPVANRMVLSVRPPWDVPQDQWLDLARSFAPLAAGAGLEKVVLRVRIPEGDGLRDAVLHFEGVGGHGVTVREEPLGDKPVRPLSPYQQKVLLAARFGSPYPYEVVRMLTPEPGAAGLLPPGTFIEYDLDEDGYDLVPVDRGPGLNTAHVVCGLISNHTDVVPEGMTRVAILSDPTKGLGNLAEPECRRINAALRLAAAMKVPVEWFAVSSGALIAMDSGTENMDWIADTLRRIIEHTQAGHQINIVVTGINVGGQPYWNAEATMLMHTKGILIMTPASAMVLTGKQALDFSGGVSAEDNFGIGGYDRVMGPNGQGQYWAPTFLDACALLLRHYDLTYVVPGERFPRRRPTGDPQNRDVRSAAHAAIPGCDFTRVGDVFDAATNPDRKKPFDIRSVMRAVADSDSEPLERWEHWRDAENSVVWDTTVGGIPVCMLGLESRKIPRRGFVPADGPPMWTSGTLFPQASRKTARAVNATSGIRPLVVLANLSGFDGSPESMRRWQLEYGSEIGRAVTNFRGPIVFVVVSRYHGGAFVVFSKALNESMEIAAVEGSYASVIGGAPAAATVFAREVKLRTEKDPRVAEVRASLALAKGAEAATLRAELARRTQDVRAEKLGEVADEFDGVHTIQRALSTGSVDEIIAAERLRPWVIEALERGMAKTIAASQE